MSFALGPVVPPGGNTQEELHIYARCQLLPIEL